MSDKLIFNWKEGMHFSAHTSMGEMDIDAAPKFGGKGQGYSPKPLMLYALAGCTALDVTALLRKMRALPEDMSVDIQGQLTDEHPITYKEVDIEYHFYDKTHKKEKIEKAVRLSLERYCGVYEMFKSFAKVNTQIFYHPSKT